MEAIVYIRRSEIDTIKWDQLVTSAPNGFIYSRSFFLDAMCSWDALVCGDYQYIMPLPYKMKAGFRYIYTPFFMGQLGIAGIHLPSPEICTAFVNAIPSSFSLVDLHLNEYNTIDALPGSSSTARTNFILPLQSSYEKIYAGFNKDARKNTRQAISHGLYSVSVISPETVVDFYKDAYGHLAKKITQKDYDNFLVACKHALAAGLGFIESVNNNEGKTVAAAFFAKDNKRIYYLLGAPSAEGKKLNATHFLISEVIKKYAGSGLIFDFEGSDIPSVAAFYKKFGPQKKVYRHIIINRLPFWIKWLKK